MSETETSDVGVDAATDTGAQPTDRLPTWVGPLLAAIGIAGILLAGVILPVHDDRELKMSCFWALRGVLVPHAILAGIGIAILLVDTREAFKALCAIAVVTSLMTMLLLHVMIPMMPHSIVNQRPHDLLALAAVAIAGAGALQAVPEVDVDEVLDAAEAAPEQSESEAV